MKAIVAEIDKKQMIVITDKGDFIKVKRQMSAGIGSEIELKPRKTYLAYRRLASMAACILMCIFLSTGVYAYYTPYSYVSVDINPSIALSLNRFERVISVNPLNEDAVSLLKDTKNLKNQDIDEALSEIIRSASEKGYIDANLENQIMVVVSAKNSKQEDKLANKVNTAATKGLSKFNNNYGVTIEKANVDSYKAALSNKVSPGKEILADKLREVIPEIKDEEIRDMSVKEAVHLIKEGREAVKAAEKDKKGKGKGNSKEENAISNKNNEKQNGKATAKPAASIKSNEGNKEKDDKVKSVEENNDSADKDNEAEVEDKDKNDKAGDNNKKNDDSEEKVNDNKEDKGKDINKGYGR